MANWDFLALHSTSNGVIFRPQNKDRRMPFADGIRAGLFFYLGRGKLEQHVADHLGLPKPDQRLGSGGHQQIDRLVLATCSSVSY